MKITKYGHACLLVEDDNRRLMIDPGSLTKLPAKLDNVAVVIVSDEHYDHFSIDNLKAILDQSPDVHIYTTAVVADHLTANNINCQAIVGHQVIDSGGFKLDLNEVDHAIVHGSSPCRVLTVKVDDWLYYASDSFVPTTAKVKVLAIPTSGPWFKTTTAIDYANAITAEYLIATHNGLNSDIGNQVIHNSMVSHIKNKQFVYLVDGESHQFN